MDDEQDVSAGHAHSGPRPLRKNYLAELRNRPGRTMRAAEDGDDDGDEICAHGCDRHVEVHEAGHAAAALHFGIPFECIVFFGKGGAPSSSDGLFEGCAGVVFGNGAPWTTDRAGSFCVALAGLYAEFAVLHHANADSAEVDKDNWHRGVGLTGQVEDDVRDAVLGRRSDDLICETDEWVRRNAERIERLADHLAVRRRQAAPDDRVVVSYDEVRSFLAAPVD